ncbi:Stress enhanced protein 2, chloroplastic [Linum perenne]
MLENQYKNILLQPRLCTLRSYGDDWLGVVKRKKDGSSVSRFFETLSEYIESSKKIQDFEIILGRFAMVIFAATVALEVVTGNLVLRKLDLVGIEEVGGACFGVVVFAAIFAWFSSARNRVRKIFTSGCNSFIDTIIDDIVDGLFYDTDLSAGP